MPDDVLALLALPLEPRVKKMAPMEFRHVEVRIGRSLKRQWTTTSIAALRSR